MEKIVDLVLLDVYIFIMRNRKNSLNSNPLPVDNLTICWHFKLTHLKAVIGHSNQWILVENLKFCSVQFIRKLSTLANELPKRFMAFVRNVRPSFAENSANSFEFIFEACSNYSSKYHEKVFTINRITRAKYALQELKHQHNNETADSM